MRPWNAPARIRSAARPIDGSCRAGSWWRRRPGRRGVRTRGVPPRGRRAARVAGGGGAAAGRNARRPRTRRDRAHASSAWPAWPSWKNAGSRGGGSPSGSISPSSPRATRRSRSSQRQSAAPGPPRPGTRDRCQLGAGSLERWPGGRGRDRTHRPPHDRRASVRVADVATVEDTVAGGAAPLLGVRIQRGADRADRRAEAHLPATVRAVVSP
jgi:hypothetical protein